MRHFNFAAAALAAALVCFPAHAASLESLSFLEGQWTSDRNGFVIEETWTDEAAGVVVGASRGVQNGDVRFLRFAVVQSTKDGVVMRFKRHNADYSSWETDGPTVMTLSETGEGLAVFTATDPASDVRRIVYRATAAGTIEVKADRIDKDGPYLVEFTLTRAD